VNCRQIKRAAKRLGCSVKDLIALAPANDPFYTGRPAEIEKAEWFAGLYARFSYTGRVHLRRIHYQAVSHANILKPDGTVYENTLEDWELLNKAAKYARYLNLVDPAFFEDKRNFAPEIFAQFYHPGEHGYQDPTPGFEVQHDDESWSEHAMPELPTLPDLPAIPDLPYYRTNGYFGVQQPYLIEIWSEKTTINDVILPLCRRYRMNYCTGKGELSISMVLDFLHRVERADRPAVILYISDYDPAGLGMPVSIARKVEFFQREFGFEGLQISLLPIALTPDQVERYDLPRVPVKDSDRRKANWIATQGQGQVELDALEALHPGELAQIVTHAVLRYHDQTLFDRARDAYYGLDGRLDDEREYRLEERRPDLNAMRRRYEELQSRYEAVRQEFAEMVAPFQERLDALAGEMEQIAEDGQALWDDVAQDMADLDLDLEEEYPLPEPDLPEEPEDILYRSERDYVSQLAYYELHRNGHVAQLVA